MDLQAQLQRYLIPFALDLLRLSIWLIILTAIFAPAEKLWGVRPRSFFRKAFGTDLIYYFLSGFAPKLLLVIPLSLLARSVHHFVPSAFYASAALLPVWLRLAASLVVGEVGGYWEHRWSHEIPLLWSFHSIHHGPEEIDWLVSKHAHPFDMSFVRLCGLIPVYVLGLAQPFGNRVDAVPLLLVLIGTVWGFFIHANVKWRFGWLELLISTPGFHHWHHTNDAPERINKNYASILPWVDKLFGTFYLPEKWPEVYGIDQPSPRGFVGQILQPLVGSGERRATAIEGRDAEARYVRDSPGSVL
jgi:sterol desaturase/sphingolipid hydroxylase (fatty acid hydroxylase superfamily)